MREGRAEGPRAGNKAAPKKNASNWFTRRMKLPGIANQTNARNAIDAFMGRPFMEADALKAAARDVRNANSVSYQSPGKPSVIETDALQLALRRKEVHNDSFAWSESEAGQITDRMDRAGRVLINTGKGSKQSHWVTAVKDPGGRWRLLDGKDKHRNLGRQPEIHPADYIRDALGAGGAGTRCQVVVARERPRFENQQQRHLSLQVEYAKLSGAMECDSDFGDRNGITADEIRDAVLRIGVALCTSQRPAHEDLDRLRAYLKDGACPLSAREFNALHDFSRVADAYAAVEDTAAGVGGANIRNSAAVAAPRKGNWFTRLNDKHMKLLAQGGYLGGVSTATLANLAHAIGLGIKSLRYSRSSKAD